MEALRTTVQEGRRSKIIGWVCRVIGAANYFEGTIHICVSCIGLWGLVALHTADFRLVLPVAENFLFGVFSIATGWIITGRRWCRYSKPICDP